MKKVLIGFLIIVVCFFVAAYVLIPGKEQIKASITMKAPLPGVFRSLSEIDSWKTFWPGDTPFKLGDQTYSVREKLYNAINIGISSGTDTIISTINLISIKSDSLTLEWTAEQINSSNPFTKVAQFTKTSALKTNLNKIIERIKEFMEQPKNIYGIDIKQTIVTDSVLVSTRRSFDHEPTLKEVDDMIQSLKRYIAEQKAVEKNYPMLNIPSPGNSIYPVMTAIAVDKELPLTNEFAPKFLLKGGNILETEVKGGPHAIKTAFKELENYRSDLKYDSPAIPYQLLVTDRLKEADTTKWITKLYYPIF